MGRIKLPDLPTDGSRLLGTRRFSDTTDPYTESLYTALDSPSDTEGLMSEINGRLNFFNMSSDFRLKNYHIQPEQSSLARMDSMQSTSTIYGDGIPNLDDDANFFTVPGCSLRWYQPYATSLSLIQWSFFLSYNYWRGVYKDMEGTYHSGGVDSMIQIRCRLDNSVVPSSTRHLGANMFHPVSPGAVDRTDHTGPGMHAFDFFKAYVKEKLGGTDHPVFLTEYDDGPYAGTSAGLSLFKHPKPRDGYTAEFATYGNAWDLAQRGGNPQYVNNEAHTATQFDLHHSTTLSKGFHEISVECSIKLPEGAGVYLQNLGQRSKSFATGRGYFNLVGKVSLGIRNARVLNLI